MFNLTPWRKKEIAPELRRGGDALLRMRDEFETLFNRFFGGLPAPGGDIDRFWALDMDETDKEYVVRAEAPGFEAKDFVVELTGNVLTLRAERKHEKEEKKNGGYKESRYASYERAVTLPPGHDPSKVGATYRNGVLEVRVTKTADAAGKRIEVKS